MEEVGGRRVGARAVDQSTEVGKAAAGKQGGLEVLETIQVEEERVIAQAGRWRAAR
jgi:hypothetical protein